MSSRKDTRQRRIDELMDVLGPGDTLVVSELSRLARSVGQIAVMVNTLLQNKVRLIAIKEKIDLNGKQDMQSKVMITMFSLFAELERDLISERTKEGLARARKQGKLLGRPKGSLGKSKLDGKEKEIKDLMDKGVTKANIAKIVGCSWSALDSFIKTRKLVPSGQK
jgi:DNA invertase Pin-like site-specific DNA recombinase